ncbi:hypothetical protein DVK44_34630 [Streptomyces paludis]|uniref:Uncharacterized protein n=1 Tax=Streptomyces paludis TaxID=2282738 RepID=A0A345HZ98_9ACTN|nr:hypothetical protein DVK44_34630 [Streptomyces paludis]
MVRQQGMVMLLDVYLLAPGCAICALPAFSALPSAPVIRQERNRGKPGRVPTATAGRSVYR